MRSFRESDKAEKRRVPERAPSGTLWFRLYQIIWDTECLEGTEYSAVEITGCILKRIRSECQIKELEFYLVGPE